MQDNTAAAEKHFQVCVDDLAIFCFAKFSCYEARDFSSRLRVGLVREVTEENSLLMRISNTFAKFSAIKSDLFINLVLIQIKDISSDWER